MKSTLLALVSLLFVSCLSDNETSKPVDYTVQTDQRQGPMHGDWQSTAARKVYKHAFTFMQTYKYLSARLFFKYIVQYVYYFTNLKLKRDICHMLLYNNRSGKTSSDCQGESHVRVVFSGCVCY